MASEIEKAIELPDEQWEESSSGSSRRESSGESSGDSAVVSSADMERWSSCGPSLCSGFMYFPNFITQANK